MSKVKIKGLLTEVKVAEVELFPYEIIAAAIPHMTIRDVETALLKILEQKFRENDPSLPPDAIISWGLRCWRKYSFTDYHKNEDVYNNIRPFNDEEEQFIISLSALTSVFK